MSDSVSGQIAEVEDGDDLWPDLTSLKVAQEQASAYEKSDWLRQGAAQDSILLP